MSTILSFVDGLAAAIGGVGPGGFAWPVVIGIALGTSFVGFRDPRFFEGVLKRRASMEFMRPSLTAIAAATALVVLVTCGVAFGRRFLGRGHVSFRAEYVLTSKRGAFLTALPLVTVVITQPLETKRDSLMLAFVAVAAILVSYSAYFWLRDERAAWNPRSRRRVLARGTLVAAMAAYAVVMTRLSFANHRNFNTARDGLGYYVSVLREASEGHGLVSALTPQGPRHFEPVLFLLAPVYRLFPFAETLLVLQSLWLAAGAVPVFLLTERLTESRRAALAVACAYLAYPAVHAANLFDFHPVTLAIPLFAWLVHALHRGASRSYGVALVLLLLVREDVTLALAGVGLFAVFSGSRPRARLGALTLAAAATWGILASVVASAHPFASLGAVATVVDRGSARRLLHPGVLAEEPLMRLSRALTTEKFDLFAKHVTALFFLPLFGRGRILLAYGVALPLLAVTADAVTRAPDDASLLVPFLFVLTALALGRFAGAERILGTVSGPRLVRALAPGLLVAAGLCSVKLGAFVENGGFSAGPRPFVRQVTPGNQLDADFLRKLSRSLPKGAKVAATNRLLPHLGGVSHLYSLADRSRAEYVVANIRLRGVGKLMAADENQGLLERAGGIADLRLYRARYGGKVPPSSSAIDDE